MKTPQNSQTHWNNSSVFETIFLSVFDDFVGLELKGLRFSELIPFLHNASESYLYIAFKFDQVLLTFSVVSSSTFSLYCWFWTCICLVNLFPQEFSITPFNTLQMKPMMLFSSVCLTDFTPILIIYTPWNITEPEISCRFQGAGAAMENWCDMGNWWKHFNLSSR